MRIAGSDELKEVALLEYDFRRRFQFSSLILWESAGSARVTNWVLVIDSDALSNGISQICAVAFQASGPIMMKRMARELLWVFQSTEQL